MTIRREPSASRAERLYRRLLGLLPPEFRGDFGESMAQDFADRDRELTGAARRRLHARELPGLLRTTLTEWLAAAWRDAHYALRMLGRAPGFTLAAVLMLAIGTGANAAIFSVIDAVLLRPAAIDPSRIVEVQEQTAGRPPTSGIPLAHVAVLARAPEFEAVAGMGGALPILTGAGAAHRVDVDCVSASLFPLMGVAPQIGRVFTAADERPGIEPVVVLSYLEWQRDFGGALGVLGRVITLDGVSNTVIGVMPAGFLGPTVRNRVGAWSPLGLSLGQRGPAGCRDDPNDIEVMARVRAPLTTDDAAARVNASGRLAGLTTRTGLPHPAIVLARADQYAVGALRTPLTVLLGAVGCVLLIACVNVANLQLERLVGRRREIAVRLALGATRSRIVRQTLVENLIVSLSGAAAGLLLARLTFNTIVALMPVYMPHVAEIAINARTLLATLVAAVATGLVVGALPALQTTRAGLTQDLSQGSRGVVGGATWVRRSLVVIEVALSLVLLVAAGLMIRTFLILRPVDPGFAAANRTIAEMVFEGPWQVEADRVRAVDAILDRIGALPGVAAVSASSYLPLSGVTDLSRVTIGTTSADVWTSWSTPGYFPEMDMPLRRGRVFSDYDTASAPPVAMVNAAMAARFWPDHDPVGRFIDVQAPDRTQSRRLIVGILETARSWGTDREARSELFVPYRQEPGSTLIYFVVRTNGAASMTLPASIRAIVAEVRPDEVVDRIETMDTKLARSVSAPRFAMWLFGVFAAAGAVLAALGLAAIIAWWVSERRREIGVRMALGASAERVALEVLREGLGLAVGGLALGVGLALLCTHLLSNWLYGVAAPTDIRTFVACVVGMLTVTTVASYLPARRAARIDPSLTLRSE